MLRRYKAERLDSPDEGYKLYQHELGPIVAVMQEAGPRIAYQRYGSFIQIAETAEMVDDGWSYSATDLRATARLLNRLADDLEKGE